MCKTVQAKLTSIFKLGDGNGQDFQRLKIAAIVLVVCLSWLQKWVFLSFCSLCTRIQKRRVGLGFEPARENSGVLVGSSFYLKIFWFHTVLIYLRLLDFGGKKAC